MCINIFFVLFFVRSLPLTLQWQAKVAVNWITRCDLTTNQLVNYLNPDPVDPCEVLSPRLFDDRVRCPVGVGVTRCFGFAVFSSLLAAYFDARGFAAPKLTFPSRLQTSSSQSIASGPWNILKEN